MLNLRYLIEIYFFLIRTATISNSLSFCYNTTIFSVWNKIFFTISISVFNFIQYGIDFLRLGSKHRVHPDLHKYTEDEMLNQIGSVQQLGSVIETKVREGVLLKLRDRCKIHYTATFWQLN